VGLEIHVSRRLAEAAGRRYVVGVDGWEGSRAALRWAAAEAARHGAELEVVHAWQPPIRLPIVGAVANPLIGSAQLYPGPLGARAQETDRIRRIGILVVSDLEPLGPFREALAVFGYVEGKNIQIDVRSAQAAELAGKHKTAARARISRETVVPLGLAFQKAFSAICISPKTPEAVITKVMIPTIVARIPDDLLAARHRSL